MKNKYERIDLTQNMLKTANYQLSCILEKIGINLFNMCHSEFILESVHGM